MVRSWSSQVSWWTFLISQRRKCWFGGSNEIFESIRMKKTGSFSIVIAYLTRTCYDFQMGFHKFNLFVNLPSTSIYWRFLIHSIRSSMVQRFRNANSFIGPTYRLTYHAYHASIFSFLITCELEVFKWVQNTLYECWSFKSECIKLLNVGFLNNYV